ncbi:hypothetical protein J2W42_005457 [Rhizobium tibeticum]|nr:hypothetical protein [Rhizobium tibeticum]
MRERGAQNRLSLSPMVVKIQYSNGLFIALVLHDLRHENASVFVLTGREATRA